jgi:hypothetical protein
VGLLTPPAEPPQPQPTDRAAHIDPFESVGSHEQRARFDGVAIRDYDRRTGRPLAGGREAVRELSDTELEAELTIAAADRRRRGARLDALLAERARRRGEEQTWVEKFHA